HPGDRVRRIDWRASARRRELCVNEFHPERNTDVVVFLDSFNELRRGGRSTLDLAVRAAAALVREYLRDRDRVGFLAFGGFLSWLVAGSGATQAYRILGAAIGVEVAVS